MVEIVAIFDHTHLKNWISYGMVVKIVKDKTQCLKGIFDLETILIEKGHIWSIDASWQFAQMQLKSLDPYQKSTYV